jgi:RNA polymerase sigma-70 factor, ECF subfamily
MITGKTERDKKFISVYHAHVDEVYQFVYLRTGTNKSIAEDLTQEIFLEVYKGLSRFKGLSSERTWVFRIAKNRLNDYYRKQYRSMFESVCIDDVLDDQLVDTGQDIQENQIKSFEQETVRASLSALPKHYEIVLTLKYMDEGDTKEIALLLGKSPKAIESLLRRAKDAFIKSYIGIEGKRVL